MSYLLEKSRFGINFFVKRNTILLLFVYQVFIFLQDHLHFFLHFSSLLWNNVFWMILYLMSHILAVLNHSRVDVQSTLGRNDKQSSFVLGLNWL